MNENEFSYGGKTYVAVVVRLACDSCDFFEKDCAYLRDLEKIPPCYAEERKDGREVCFVEKGARR